MEFPDAEAAREFQESPEYQEISVDRKAGADAVVMKAPSPSWWINFRVIEEGNWGSRGGVLSFKDLLDQGSAAFPPERAAAIRTALSVKYDR